MATIVGGIATSHTPTIGFALDTDKQRRSGLGADLRGLRARPAVARGEEAGRAVLHLQRSRHVVLLRSLLALRARHRRRVRRSRTKAAARAPLPPIKGHPQLAQHIATGLVADEFDLSLFPGQGARPRRASRRCRCCWPHEPAWPGAIVPLQVGVLEFPIPTARRCFKLGRSLRKAIQSYPEDIKVADRRHRRALAPGARRALRASTTRRGTWSSSTCSRRIRSSSTEHDDRRVRRRAAASKAPKSSCG